MKNPTPKKQPDEFIPFEYPIITKRRIKEDFNSKNREFLEVIFSRRSTTNRMNRISIIEIEELLYFSTKIQSIQIDENSFVISKRTAPSGGARHPIDLLVSLPNRLETRELIYYNPIDLSMNGLEISKLKLSAFFNEVNKNVEIGDSCLIWFAIQTDKTGSKYLNPESLYWRDSGALLYCIQLIANYLGYKSCPLGSLAANSFNFLFDTPCLLSGGGILIGK
jgi:SagB-type dehydrogenase family enzyme